MYLKLEWSTESPDMWFMVSILSVGFLASVLIYFLQKNKVEKRVWILVPFSLVCSILVIKSAAGVVVDGIAVSECLHSLYQESLELIRSFWVRLYWR